MQSCLSSFMASICASYSVTIVADNAGSKCAPPSEDERSTSLLVRSTAPSRWTSERTRTGSPRRALSTAAYTAASTLHKPQPALKRPTRWSENKTQVDSAPKAPCPRQASEDSLAYLTEALEPDHDIAEAPVDGQSHRHTRLAILEQALSITDYAPSSVRTERRRSEESLALLAEAAYGPSKSSSRRRHRSDESLILLRAACTPLLRKTRSI